MKVKNVLFATFTASIFFTACGNSASESTTKQVEKTIETVKTEAAKAEFICPMKCENGKIFDAAGKCPTCKMDLVAVTHKDGDGHDHSK
jgi:hypothetical protein